MDGGYRSGQNGKAPALTILPFYVGDQTRNKQVNNTMPMLISARQNNSSDGEWGTIL